MGDAEDIETRKQENKCIYKRNDGSYCSIVSVPDDDYCILHSREDKSRTTFRTVLEEQLATDKPVLDIEGFSFRQRFVFGDFASEKTTEINARGASFNDGVDFSRLSLQKAVFNDASFNGNTFFNESQIGNVHFDNARFQNLVSFKECSFGESFFREARFEGKADFSHSLFDGYCAFENAEFVQNVDFRQATFRKMANFQHAKFTEIADFRSVSCGNKTNFSDTVLLREIILARSKFHDSANFDYITSNQSIDFYHVAFGDNSSFVGTNCLFKNTKIGKNPRFGKSRISGLIENTELGWGTSFYDVDLEKLIFRNVNLEGCLFANSFGLERCQFHHVKWGKEKYWYLADQIRLLSPDVYRENCGKDFNNLVSELQSIPEQETDEFGDELYAVETAYRELKFNYESHKNFPDAGHFHIGEMEMRLRRKKGWQRRFSIINAYRSFSDYGENWGKALMWYAAIILICAFIYPFNGFKVDAREQSLEAQNQIQIIEQTTTPSTSPVKLTSLSTSLTSPTALHVNMMIQQTEDSPPVYHISQTSDNFVSPTLEDKLTFQNSVWKQSQIFYSPSSNYFFPTFLKGLEFSFRVTFLRIDGFSQLIQPDKSLMSYKLLFYFSKLVLLLEAIFAPLTLGLFALAVRRKVRRN